MDGMLSQDEINALLAGMNISDSSDTPAPEPETEGANPVDDSTLLTDMEKDAIGEVANISMGSSATTLYSLVNRKVNITTPNVSIVRWENVIEEYQRPCVFIQIRYTQGLDGSNILILREHDVKVITDLMMGGDGVSNLADELSELHLSAISEAMNQMMGASATSLSTMLNKLIDISPPEATLVDVPTKRFGGDIADFLEGAFVKITFRMQIEDLVDSTILQLYPLDFAKSLCDIFLGGGIETPATEPAASQGAEAGPEVSSYVPPTMQPQDAGTYADPTNQMNYGQAEMPQMGMQQMGMSQMGMPQMGMPQMGMPQMGMPQMGMPQMGMPQMGMPQMTMGQDMNVQTAQFQNFQGDYSGIPGAENMRIIKDVPLEVTVELGRTVKAIADILDFAPGTIIELDKIAGEPVDVLVNGKHVAKGEVVVVEESFGVRVTEIVK